MDNGEETRRYVLDSLLTMLVRNIRTGENTVARLTRVVNIVSRNTEYNLNNPILVRCMSRGQIKYSREMEIVCNDIANHGPLRQYVLEHM